HPAQRRHAAAPQPDAGDRAVRHRGRARRAARAEPGGGVTDALLIVGGERSPEIRHELAVGPPDPVVWLERDGVATVWAAPLDVVLIGDAGGVADVRSLDEFGFAEVRRELPPPDVFAVMARRAVAGLARVRVPWDFPVHVADALRAAGVEVI